MRAQLRTPNQRQRRRLNHAAQVCLDVCTLFDMKRRDGCQELLQCNQELPSCQMRSDTAVGSAAERIVSRRSIELYLVRKRELFRIATGERGAHGDLVARLDRHTLDLCLLDTGPERRDRSERTQ